MATYGAPRESEEIASERKGKDLRNGCIGCFGLFVMLVLLLVGIGTCNSNRKENEIPQALKDCEQQIKSRLPFPETYVPIGTGLAKFRAMKPFEENTELSEWSFQYTDEKPRTVLGQANEKPVQIGRALCSIDITTKKGSAWKAE